MEIKLKAMESTHATSLEKQGSFTNNGMTFEYAR